MIRGLSTIYVSKCLYEVLALLCRHDQFVPLDSGAWQWCFFHLSIWTLLSWSSTDNRLVHNLFPPILASREILPGYAYIEPHKLVLCGTPGGECPTSGPEILTRDPNVALGNQNTVGGNQVFSHQTICFDGSWKNMKRKAVRHDLSGVCSKQCLSRFIKQGHYITDRMFKCLFRSNSRYKHEPLPFYTRAVPHSLHFLQPCNV